MKGISMEDFPENCVGSCPTFHVGGAHELFQRVIKQIRLGGLSNKFFQNSVAHFREQKVFVLKTGYFTRIWLRHV